MKKEILDALNEIIDTVNSLPNDSGIWAEILPAIAEKLDSSIDRNILSGGRWDGNASNIGLFSGGNVKWRPLADSTKKAYSSGKPKITNLSRTLDRNAGGLRSSIEVRPLNRAAIEFGIGEGAKKGVKPKVYAAIHNFGGTINIPARTQKMKFKWIKAGKAVFAKKKAKGKGVFEKDVKIPSYKITIPPSPYMVIQQEDLDYIYDMITETYMEAMTEEMMSGDFD